MTFRRGALSIGVGNAISKVLGVIREVVFAYALGTSRVADSFRLALSLVLIPTQFATGELTTASVVPILRRTWLLDAKAGTQIAWRFGAVLVVFGFLVALGITIGAGWIVTWFAPGFDQASQLYARGFLRVLGLAAPLYALGTALALIGIAVGQFRLTALKPAVRNVGLLVGLALFLRFRHDALLAWGFVIGYVLFLALGIGPIRKALVRRDSGQSTVVSLRLAWWEIWTQMRALSVLVVTSQIALILERVITTLAGSGAVAAIDYARFVTETPILLIAMPVAIAALAKFADGEWADHREQGARLCRAIVYGTVPLAVGAATAGPLIVSVLFQRGAFGASSATLVNAALTGSALGIVTGSLAYFAQRVFSARRRNRELLIGLFGSTIVSLSLAIIFVRSRGVLAIGLASSIGQGVYAVWAIHRLGLLREFRLPPIVTSFGAAVIVWLALQAGAFGPQCRWILVIPAFASLMCMLAFRSVREDLVWAIPWLRAMRPREEVVHG